MIENINRRLKLVGKNLWKVLPIILFFLVLFYGVIFFFGTKYLLLVSVATTVFKVNYQKYSRPREILAIVAEQMLMCILAFAATLNLPLCVLMNAIVPFFLVLLRSTRFKQRGYFGNAMGFVFLQLRPVGWAGFESQVKAYAFILIYLAAALLIAVIVRGRNREYQAVREGFKAAAERFRSLSKGVRIKGISLQMASIQNRFHAGTAEGQGAGRDGSSPYIFALLFQRTAYFIINYLQDKDAFNEADKSLFVKMADYLDDVGVSLNSQDNEALIQRAGELLNETDDASEQFQSYTRDFLHLLVMGLKRITSKNSKTGRYTLDWRRFLREKRERLRPNQFEMRFALRLSIVLSVSFLFCRLVDVSHSYWVPLNAFFLVQPMYEESTRRLKNRVIGTILGSVVVHFSLMYLQGTTAHFALATVMVSFMYSFVPGSVLQVLFSTGFALTLAALTLASTTAIELRIVYVIVAVILVLLANRFCFPTSLFGQFRFNVWEMMHMQNNYLDFLLVCCRRKINYEIMGDALSQFNLTYGQAMEYLAKDTDGNMTNYRGLLNVLWRMVSEVEQMVFYLTTEEINSKEKEGMRSFVALMKEALKPEDGFGKPYECEELSPYLEHLIVKYQNNVKKLKEMYRDYPELKEMAVKGMESN